jgi:hypothetical protein
MTDSKGIPVELGSTILKLLEEQGRSIGQIRDELAKIGRLEERIAAHAAGAARAEDSDRQLWTELRELEKRVRVLEQNGQRDYTRWQIAGGTLQRWLAPLAVAAVLSLAGFYFGTQQQAKAPTAQTEKNR